MQDSQKTFLGRFATTRGSKKKFQDVSRRRESHKKFFYLISRIVFAREKLFPATRVVYKLFTMVCMLLLTGVVIAYVRYGRRGKFHFLPQPWSRRYILFTGLFLLLLLLSPANFTQWLPAVGITLYGSVVTPLYEELIFRGYLWNRLSAIERSPRRLILYTALLFAVWHVGYMVNALAEGNWVAVVSKVLVGFCYGLLLGWVRTKAGNCYASCLLHGLMNRLSI